MKHSVWQDRTAVILFFLTLISFFAFFGYMFTNEQVSVFQLEQTHTYSTLTNVESSVRHQDDAPAGVVKVYRGILDPQLSNESCLCFNIAHHNIDVYFEDILVYRLEGAQSNQIGQNVSSNWCSVHVGDDHAGKQFTVLLTPLMEAAIGKEPVFLLGSHYSIAMDVLIGELPMLILSALCILLGLFVVSVSLYFSFLLKTGNGGMIYLGFFAIMLALWKITDLRCIPLLVPTFSMAAGYISVGALFLTAPCLLMYFRTLFENHRQGLLLLLSAFASLVCLYVLAMQLLGGSELRQNLTLSHILLILAIVSIPGAAVLNRIIYKSWGVSRSWRLLALLFLGIGVDLVFYYLNNGNGLLSLSITSFIAYMMIVFLRSVQESTRKAYTDSRTGLDNRTRWNELMHTDTDIEEPYAIAFIDLNGLKRVNDTLGHEAGDRMIFQLSSILRNTLPRNSVICRWGGDEFAALLPGITREKLNDWVDALFAASASYNTDHPELPIHFAVGTALSTEHPGITRSELFHLADEDMYRSKQRWYAHR